MKLVALLGCFLLTINAHAFMGTGSPFKFISSCELDFNDDDRPDIAMLAETLSGRELIVLLRTATGYESYILEANTKRIDMSCHFGNSVKETTATPGKGIVHKTPGTYIKLAQPESSAVVFFWHTNEFKKVWISD